MGKHDPMKDNPEVIRLKLDAKEVRRLAPHLSNAQTLEVAARAKGYSGYDHFRAFIKGETTKGPKNA